MFSSLKFWALCDIKYIFFYSSLPNPFPNALWLIKIKIFNKELKYVKSNYRYEHIPI